MNQVWTTGNLYEDKTLRNLLMRGWDILNIIICYNNDLFANTLILMSVRGFKGTKFFFSKQEVPLSNPEWTDIPNGRMKMKKKQRTG